MSAKKPKKAEPAKSGAEPAVPTKHYQPTPKEEASVREYFTREKARPKPAKVKVEKHEGRKATLELEPATGPYVQDSAAGIVAGVRLSETFGGIDFETADRFLTQITNGTRTEEGTHESAVNHSLALVAAIAPRDGIEAMLAVQMVNTHGLICDLQRRMMNNVETIPQQDSTGGLLVKMLRTFTAQTETLKRYRSTGEQRVTVQHVTVNAEKAAVAVNPPQGSQMGGQGVTIKSEDQPHEPRSEQLAYQPGDPMPCTFQENAAALPEPLR